MGLLDVHAEGRCPIVPGGSPLAADFLRLTIEKLRAPVLAGGAMTERECARAVAALQDPSTTVVAPMTVCRMGAIFARGQCLLESIAVANCSLNRASSSGLWNPIWVRSMWRSVSNVFRSARPAPRGSVSPVPMCQMPSAVGQAMY